MATATNSATGNLTIPEAPKKISNLRWAWRIVRWTSYVFSAITLLMMLHKVEPPLIATSPEAAARVEEKFAEVARTALSGHSATLRIDETELNSYLGTFLDLEPNGKPSAVPANAPGAAPIHPGAPTAADVEHTRSSVRDVKIQLIEDRAKAYVLFDMLGKDVTLQLEGRLSTVDGYLRFEPLSGQLGTMTIPKSAMDAAVKQLMDSPENREKLRLPVNIADLRIENGEVVATYR